MSVELVILTGLQVAGKTTFYRLLPRAFFTVAKQLVPPAPEEGGGACFMVRLTEQGFVVDALASR